MNNINKITCTVCNKTKGVRPDVLAKRVEKYGSLEILLSKYTCQKCRTENRVNAVGETNKDEEGRWVPTPEKCFWLRPGYVFPHERRTRRLTQEEFAEATLTQCFHPDKCNAGVCCLCPHFEYCKLTDEKGHLYKKTQGAGGTVQAFEAGNRRKIDIKKKGKKKKKEAGHSVENVL